MGQEQSTSENKPLLSGEDKRKNDSRVKQYTQKFSTNTYSWPEKKGYKKQQ